MYHYPVLKPRMQNSIAEKGRQLAFAKVVEHRGHSEADAWSVRRETSFVQLVKPSVRPNAQVWSMLTRALSW